MKLFTLFFLLLTAFQLQAQGWIWQSGSSTSTEILWLIWNDTDSTVVCVGDSAGLIVRKQFDHHGQLLSSHQGSSISQNGSGNAFLKHDFGFTVLTKSTYYTSWSTFNSISYYALHDPAGNLFAGGAIAGHNGNDYGLYDALLTSDSAALAVGVHLNPDENKLYLQKTFPDHQGDWIKELHDSTKNLQGLRIYPVSDNRYLLLAMRQGNIGTNWVNEFGFLLINASGDLLEANWVPNSGVFTSSTDAYVPISQDADGFSILKKDQHTFYHFDAMGHLLWSKFLPWPYIPLASAGEHRLVIPAELWPGSIYFLDIQSDDYQITKKLVKE